MPSERVALERVVGSVADGTADIDWDAIEANLQSARDRQLLRQLRILARISDVHRSQPDADPDAEPSMRLEPASVLLQDGEESVSKVIGRIEPQTLPPMPVAAGDGQVPPGDLPTRWGHLEIRERVGQGTFGEVFRAFDTQLHREVALKLLRAGSSPARLDDRVLREGRILARLRHPNVVGVYGAESREGRVGLWMEFIRGATLEELLRRQGSFSAREAALIGQDLCRAVAAVHAAGLVHRDIKAQNVMREKGGRVVLMDFGAGQYRAESARGTVRLTGTPLYLAPEVLNGGEATPASDIYSIGVLLYRLVTNDFPVKAATLDDLKVAHRAGQAKRLHDVRPDLPDAFVQVVERALAADPRQRPSSAGALQAALADHPLAPPKPRVLDSYVLKIAAALLVVVCAGLATLALRRDATPRPSAPASVAVLPFKTVTPGRQAIVDGLTGLVVGELGSHGETIRVTALSSSEVAARQGQGGLAAARLLDVDHVVEGMVSWEAGEIVVDVQMAGLTTTPARRRFRSPPAGVSRLAGRIAAYAASALGVGPRTSSGRHGPRDDVASDFVEAMSLIRNPTAANVAAALVRFERVQALDPTFAGGYYGLAYCYEQLATDSPSVNAELARAQLRQALDRAVDYGPEDAETQALLGDYRFAFERDWAAAEDAFRRAADLNPSSTEALYRYAMFLAARGRVQEGEALLARAREVAPLTPFLISYSGAVARYARDFPRSIAFYRHALAMSPEQETPHIGLARTLRAAGRHDEALAELLRVPPAPRIEAEIAQVHALAGRRDAARRILASLRQRADRGEINERPMSYALILAALGERDEAMSWLEREIGDHQSRSILFLAVDERLDSLRQEPRFQQLLARLHLPSDAAPD